MVPFDSFLSSTLSFFFSLYLSVCVSPLPRVGISERLPSVLPIDLWPLGQGDAQMEDGGVGEARRGLTHLFTLLFRCTA